jgi:hypothetical protein
MISADAPAPTFFGRSRLLLIVTVLAIIIGGIALRLTNLTAPPLDVHGWRQMRSAAIARGMYYDTSPTADPALKEQAHYLGAVFGQLEPPLFERLVADTYVLLGSEVLWVARLYSIIFWLAASLAVFFLAWKVTSVDGAVAALALQMFLPFGVTFSRVFMPDPLYVMWMWLGIFVFYRWVESQKWKLAALAGIFIGISILVKVFAAFMLIPAVAMFLLAKLGFRQVLKNRQFYLLVALSGIIPAIYYLFLIPGSSGNYLETWSLPYLHLLKDPAFYLRWFHWLSGLFNPVILVLAAISIAFFRKAERWLMVGLWIGFLIFGMTLPSLITSHSYYSLPLEPILSLSLAGLAALLLPKIAQSGKVWQVVFLGLALISAGDAAIAARKEINGADYAAQAAFWKDLSDQLPDGRYVGLLADYNAPMGYYGWRFVASYPYSYDLDMARMGGKEFNFTTQAWEFFKSYTDGYDYFLITELTELTAQPYLHDILFDYYPVVKQTKDYYLFDLRHPLKPIPGS